MDRSVVRAWELASDVRTESAFATAAGVGARLVEQIEAARKCIDAAMADLAEPFSYAAGGGDLVARRLDEAHEQVTPVVARCQRLAG